jgi:hypothetical protein
MAVKSYSGLLLVVLLSLASNSIAADTKLEKLSKVLAGCDSDLAAAVGSSDKHAIETQLVYATARARKALYQLNGMLTAAPESSTADRWRAADPYNECLFAGLLEKHFSAADTLNIPYCFDSNAVGYKEGDFDECLKRRKLEGCENQVNKETCR